MGIATSGVATVAKSGSAGITGNVTLSQGTGVTLTQSGNDISVAASGGQTLVTRIVASSGGDHTTLGAALTAASAGDVIYVRAGTYSESAITSSLANITIIGDNAETTVIAMGANALTLNGAYQRLQNIKITFSTGVATVVGDDLEMVNCHYAKTGSGSDSTFQATRALIQGCRFASSQTDAVLQLAVGGAYSRVFGNYFDFNASNSAGVVLASGNYMAFKGNTCDYATSGTGQLYRITGSNVVVSGNNFFGGGTTGANPVVQCSGTGYTFTGNEVTNGQLLLNCAGETGTVSGNRFYGGLDGIQVNNAEITITGNQFFLDGTTSGNTGVDVVAAKDRCSILGNFFYNMDVGVNVAASTVDDCAILGNHFSDLNVTTPIVDAGTNTHIEGNKNVTSAIEKVFKRMKNTSGGALAAGDLVVRKAVAAGDEVTTSTTAGTNLIFGVVAEAISNNAYGRVQVLGKTTALKVNGTTDIAIGDYISHFTSAGIGQKASAGDTAIAYALEAYITDDSSGVIDAILIHPLEV